MFQPLSLISNKNVEIKTIRDEQNENLAWVQPNGENTFVITLNDFAIEKKYDESWVRNHITLEYYKLGFLLHEICHIKYDSFAGKDPFSDKLFQFIKNVVDDTRIENTLWYEYPFYAQALRWALASVRPTIKDLDAQREETLERIQKLCRTLFHVSRFGIIEDGDDTEFVSFFLPLTLSATSNGQENLLEACSLIYLWVLEQCEDDEKLQKSLKKASGNGGNGEEAIGEKEIEESVEGEQVADSGVLELVKKAHEKIDAQTKSIGHGDEHIVLEDKSNAFARQVIEERGGEIAEMHTTFRLTREGWDEVAAYEGDTIGNLVNAYVNSFTYDEGLDYTEARRVVPAMTLWAVRDVSDSTSDMMKEYAEICVMLHASLVDIPKVRSGQIDFADDAVVVKEPQETLSESKLYPYTNGGTYLTSAVELLEQADFGNDQKVLCILTDGGFYDSGSVKERVDALVEEKGIDETFIIYVNERQHDLSGEQEIIGYPAYYCGPKDIPEVIYNVVVRLRERW